MSNLRNCQSFEDCDFPFKGYISHHPYFQNSLNVLYMIFQILFQFLLFFFLRSMFFIPQSATFTTFFTPIPAFSHFSLVGIIPEKKENSPRILKVSITDFLFLKKKVLSFPYAKIKNL